MSDLISINVMLKEDTRVGQNDSDQEAIIQVVMKNDRHEFLRKEWRLYFMGDMPPEHIGDDVAQNLKVLIRDMVEDLA